MKNEKKKGLYSLTNEIMYLTTKKLKTLKNHDQNVEIKGIIGEIY